jgi:hypothetical protein
MNGVFTQSAVKDDHLESVILGSAKNLSVYDFGLRW